MAGGPELKPELKPEPKPAAPAAEPEAEEAPDPAAAARAEAKSYRLKLRKAKQERAGLQRELDELRAGKPQPNGKPAGDPELQAKYDALAKTNQELAGKVRARTYQDAFRAALDDEEFAGDLLIKKIPVQKLWALAGYSPGAEEEPDPDEIKDVLLGLKESDQYLFAAQPPAAANGQAPDGAKSPRPPGPGAARGSPAGNPKMVVSLANTLDPVWMAKNQAELHKAIQAGEVRYVD